MITLFVLAVLLISLAVYTITSVAITLGPALFVIVDIIVAVKILCWIFKPKSKKE